MRILLLGEYSNVHWTLAEGLRQLEHEVTVVSNGDFWKDYPRDVDVSRPKGPFSGLRLMAQIRTLMPQWRDYDVVQLINPMFLELRAERLTSIYSYLRRNNRKMVLGAFGMDWYWVHTCTFLKPLRYSDFNIGSSVRTDEIAQNDRSDWLGTAKERLNKLIANDCDGIVTGLYEYDVCYRPQFPEKTCYIPYPIVPENTETPAVMEKTDNSVNAPVPLRLFIGISKGRSRYKGTDIMYRAAEAIRERYPDRLQIVKAEGVPFAEYQQLMDGSDAIMDQLYSYTPAMNALMAMSKGIICIGGGEPENYKILGEKELRPIINVAPTFESVCQELEQLVLHPERIPVLKRQSKEYVYRHHHYLKVAKQYESFYQLLG